MNLEQRIRAFERLGEVLRDTENHPENLQTAKRKAKQVNGWFIPEFIDDSLKSIGESLIRENLLKWLKEYNFEQDHKPKVTGVIMAGNIPVVGFHDFLCVLISGNIFKGKLSSSDPFLLPAVAEILLNIEPGFKKYIEFTDARIGKMDQVIATGSNNTSRYFEYYFGKYPHIIRKSRNSAAILTGEETSEDFKLLGKDIFQYYGLGCRNVSKLFVPEGHDFTSFFEGIFSYSWVMDSNKYANNYDYNKTLYLMNDEKLWDNNFLLLKHDIGLASPIATLYYEFYKSKDELEGRLLMDKPHLQCIVAKSGTVEGSVDLGQSQAPKLWDYADNVDTLKFLLSAK